MSEFGVSKLSEGELFGWAQSYAKAGWTATAAAESLRSAFSFSNKPWFDMFREAFARVGFRETIAKVPKSYTVPTSMMGINRTHDWEKKYNFITDVRYFNRETKTWVTEPVQVQSDELLTKGGWYDLVEEALKRGSPEGYDEDRGFTVRDPEFWIRGRQG